MAGGDVRRGARRRVPVREDRRVGVPRVPAPDLPTARVRRARRRGDRSHRAACPAGGRCGWRAAVASRWRGPGSGRPRSSSGSHSSGRSPAPRPRRGWRRRVGPTISCSDTSPSTWAPGSATATSRAPCSRAPTAYWRSGRSSARATPGPWRLGPRRESSEQRPAATRGRAVHPLPGLNARLRTVRGAADNRTDLDARGLPRRRRGEPRFWGCRSASATPTSTS